MIPSVLCSQLRQGVNDFLLTTFPVSTPLFHGLVERLLAAEGGVFRGPYLSIQLPFRRGESGADFFPDVPLPFPPHLHQERAFERLSEPGPRSAIVATGTGSGKTECYLQPILDHCCRHRNERGIKAILVYPMNALAADQAGRLARAVRSSPKLRGNVTAGLYVGRSEAQPHRVMGPENIVTCKETQRLSPPDILLTNYKMLDYLLIRPRDRPLWQFNGPLTLRFLVVDELHTFDGAQGTDLACLVRRLKARLGTPENFLCCVGTSATLGSESEREGLRRYAETVFGEPFDEGAIIGEARRSAGEFLEKSLISRVEVPPPGQAHLLDPEFHESCPDYVRAQHELWLGEAVPRERFHEPSWRMALGEKLKGHRFFQNLLKVLKGRTRRVDEILGELERVTPELRGTGRAYREHLLNSLLALVSEARVPDGKDSGEGEGSGDSGTAPFLHVRLQLWLRELRRMVAQVALPSRLRFADDLSEEQRRTHLPAVHCRECGSTGWAGLKRQYDTHVNPDLQSFYIAFFNHDPKVIFLFPEEAGAQVRPMDQGARALCPACLHLGGRPDAGSCPSCGHAEPIRVFVPHTRVKRGNRVVGVRDCPYCGAPESLSLMGSRAASLASVLVAQLYASGFNDDKKLLAFSDSVQDASHRAGFFGARTYRFTLRTAIQQYLLARGNGKLLSEIPRDFSAFWKERMDEKTFVATFLAPNMGWLRDFRELKAGGRLPGDSRLVRDVERRLEWEILGEFGFNACIGRTLEKTGSSAASLHPERMDAAVRRLLEVLENEMEELRNLDGTVMGRFLAGFLTHLKNQGGVFHPVLEEYVKKWGDTYPISSRHIPWMPGFSPRNRAPAFLSTRPGTRFDPLFSRASGQRTWSQAWAEKCFFPVHPLVRAVTDRLYEPVLNTLVEEGVLEERRMDGDRVWGLSPGALRVACHPIRFRCGRCGHDVSADASQRPYFEGAPCLRFHCPGRYGEREETVDYYAKLYATGDVQRIFTDEHTGLVPREEREELERRFKIGEAERKPWDPNLLSCTPTLEMGIDIGDLSSLILCSVPPSLSGYLQRIGRAGRRDGNALNVTVANGRPHDLYFFAAPEEMIAGAVEPPGVFLNASAVLERQLAAFCFDRWVQSGIEAGALPARISQILGNLDPVDWSRFPYVFLRFIESHQTELLERFTALFEGALGEESRARLRAFLEGDEANRGSLRYRIVEGLHALRRERDSLRGKVRLLRDRIRRKEEDPAKDRNHERDLLELKREKEALQALVKEINDRNTFNFFTDEGLIPNYAFPEAGVVLRSIIHRKKEKDELGQGGRRYDVKVYEYERPAVSAIGELAPENRFYAGGRKVVVDQIGVAVSEVETWRFCDRCSCMELLGKGEETATCPRCGSPFWADEGQKRRMVRMRQVFATTSDRESRIGDDSDDREPSFYNKRICVDHEDSAVRAAYRLDADELPFGFEFLSRATFREVNFGEKGEAGEHVTIAGVELPRKGFTFCRHCGKVQRGDGKGRHSLACTSRNRESDGNFTDCVYLYREFASEAVRILLPVTTFEGSEGKLHSFVAALQLGLRKKFGGGIDHLRTTVCEEPVPDSAWRKRYLLLYDTVPGGTGYLKELMRSREPLMDVFERALDTLRSCPCNREADRDGCYRCLFAYRNSYTMAETSRDTAVELLSGILKRRGKLVPTDTVRNVSVNALFDSELEVRFMEALRRAREEDPSISVKKELVNGKPGYFLRIGERAYYVEPQVDLGPGDGAALRTRADFLFRPARACESAKPVAVFTDGYRFHRDRLGEDLARRMAVRRSGRFAVWSITWKDVENRFRSQAHFFANDLDPENAPGGRSLNKLLEGCGLGDWKGLHNKDSFHWLLCFLRSPDEDSWRRYAFLQGLIRLDHRRFGEAKAVEDWWRALEERAPESVPELVREPERPDLYGWMDAGARGGSVAAEIFVAARSEAARRMDPQGLRLVAFLDDGYENREREAFQAAWNGFLRLHNLFQFLPRAFLLTREGVRQGLYGNLGPASPSPAEGEPPGEGDGWAEARELADERVREILDALEEARWPVPVVGYELADDSGAIAGEAELAWEDGRLAVLLDDQLEYRQAFAEAGWKTVALDEIPDDPRAFASGAEADASV